MRLLSRYIIEHLYKENNKVIGSIGIEEYEMEDKLSEHLQEIDKTVTNRYNLLMKQFAEQENITEELKAINQLEWVGKMNSIKNRAEEIIFNELIYV